MSGAACLVVERFAYRAHDLIAICVERVILFEFDVAGRQRKNGEKASGSFGWGLYIMDRLNVSELA